IEDHLDDVPQAERSLLLRELLELELDYRRQSGETLVVEDYVGRFPEHADLIQAIFNEQIVTARTKESDSSDHQVSTGPEGNRSGEVVQPERLGRYRITGKLGEGGFGVVFKGYDDELRREVAIKVPHRTLVSRPEEAELYLTEARTVAALDHPNIVPVY